ncbi:uncharacterized protein LOC123701969 [Colias croceus]|uniref:uncharacterized protein LOC123701969 n=1 Tax=Colias crocea TaxID=72248 RepID=UPI001E281561|nr:uncharacterized protein LOC123701969 [Colias croceus]
MLVNILLIFLVDCALVFTLQHQKFLHKTLWDEKCKKHDVALNDCNWCWCDKSNRYSCKARVCSEVDMFGHFQDAIQTINVGMEGHGVWRSTPSACSPGVQYHREDMLCVCTEDGNWPNPVCRDALRMLHPVEVTELSQPDTNYSCTPMKLYLVGCHVCFCAEGYIDPNLCTNTTCYQEPQLDNTETMPRSKDISDDLEIYATCKPNVMYSFGCKTCKCLKNNRLICEPCKEKHKLIGNETQTTCPRSIFKDGCNLCYCDMDMRKVCTIRKCLSKDTIKYTKTSHIKHRTVPAPLDYEDCEPGTKFIIDCNTCKCMTLGNKKLVQCTARPCNSSSNLERIKNDCVVGTTFIWKCMQCSCIERDGVKIQSCFTDKACTVSPKSLSSDVKSLNGYCEPLHTYRDDCNQCRCLADGETVVCTSKICKNTKPISVDIVPVKLRSRNRCPKGRSFHLKCNMCFCLANGNSMCTTSDCRKEKFKVYPVLRR